MPSQFHDGGARAAADRAVVGEIRRGPIDASRRRNGHAALNHAEVEALFADARPPTALSAPPSAGSFAAKRAARREAANALMASQGLRTDRTGIDELYGNLAAKLDTELPRGGGAPAGRPHQGAAVDWGAIAARLNAEAGLKPPARARA